MGFTVLKSEYKKVTDKKFVPQRRRDAEKKIKAKEFAAEILNVGMEKVFLKRVS